MNLGESDVVCTVYHLTIATQQPDVWYRCDVQLIKVAPDDGLI